MRVTRAKGSHAHNDTAQLLLMANRATSEGGIKDEWLTHGLGQDVLSTECTEDKPVPCASHCTIIWLESRDCSMFNTSHINVAIRDTEDALARLDVRAHALALSDGEYNFSIHLPHPFSNGSQTTGINATFTVSGDPTCSPGSRRIPDPSGPDGAAQCSDCEAGNRELQSSFHVFHV